MIPARPNISAPREKWMTHLFQKWAEYVSRAVVPSGTPQHGDVLRYNSTNSLWEVLNISKTWDDLRIEPVVKTTGVSAPTLEKWLDNGAGSTGVFLYSFDDALAAAQKEIHFNMQMPHNWDGSAIELHVHWIPNLADTAATPFWLLEYSFAGIGQVFGNTTRVEVGGNTAGDADLTAFKHYITPLTTITPVGDQANISSILVGRLRRISGDVRDTYDVAGNKVGLLYIDAHYRIDGLGSSTATSK